MNNLTNQKKILVLISDAGSSAYICSIIKNESNFFNWKIYALNNSPALNYLKINKFPYIFFSSLKDINLIINKEKPNIVLYGTGWIDFSSFINKTLRKKNKDVITFGLIDHWTGYKIRFSKNSLPDAILVSDSIAKKKAKIIFSPKTSIFQIRNYYLENLKSYYASIKNRNKNSIVFISEPTKVKNNPLDFNKFEYDFLEDIMKKFKRVIIRLHPTEHKKKYNDIILRFKKNKIKVVEAHKENLATTLSQSKLTIGIESTALYISYLLGIKTISYIPNKFKKPSIPLPSKYVLNNLKKIKYLDFSDNKKKKKYPRTNTFYEVVNLFLKKKDNDNKLKR